MIVKGDLPMNIRWTLNENDIISGVRGFSIINLSKKSILDISSLDEIHRGIYKCIAENVAGISEYSSELLVNGTFWSYLLIIIFSLFFLLIYFKNPVPPVIMPFSFGDESFNTGDSAGVQCMIVKGDVPMNIEWTLNDQSIFSGRDGFSIINLSKKSILDIASLDQIHRGVYKCIALNKAGISEFSSELHVNGI